MIRRHAIQVEYQSETFGNHHEVADQLEFGRSVVIPVWMTNVADVISIIDAGADPRCPKFRHLVASSTS